MAHVISQNVSNPDPPEEPEVFNFLTVGGGTGIHEQVMPGNYDLPISIGIFPGVVGESHIVDATKGREVMVPLCLKGYGSQSDLDAALEDLRAQQGVLNGDLTIDDTVYPKCTFLGFQEQRRFPDGSNIHGWVVKGVLQWRQRSRPEPAPP